MRLLKPEQIIERNKGNMKLWKIAASAVLAGTLVFSGCGNNASQPASSASAQTETKSASSTESASSGSSASSSSEASEAGTEKESASSSSGSGEEASGEDYTAELLPVFSGDYTYEDCMKLGPYKGISLTETIEEVTDEDIDAYIKSMAEAEEVTDPNATAQMGDTANIAYVGTKDGAAFEGGTSDGYDLVLGSGSFIPGFEEGVVGMKVGEEKDINLTFPEDYHAADLAGADVVFHVTLNSIKRAPEITDEWVSEYYEDEFSNVQELRDYTRETLESNAKNAAESALRQNAWQQVFNNTEFYKLPEDLINEGASQYEAQYEAAATQYGMTVEAYMEAAGLTQEDLDREKAQYAQSVAKNVLVMNAIWEAEKLQEDEEYEQIIGDLASAYGLSAEEFMEQQDKNAVEQYAKTQKILNFIVDNAKVTKE